MKTVCYNPSNIEIEFAEALSSLQQELQNKIKSNKIISIENKVSEDNPILLFKLQDNDGDTHEIVIRIIQRTDK